MDFVIRLSILPNWKGESYDFILVIIDWLIKMVHYEPSKISIHILGLAKLILDMVVQHYSFSNSIIFNRGSLFISKFSLSLCYFFSIKQRLLTAFHPQTNGQTEY